MEKWTVIMKMKCIIKVPMVSKLDNVTLVQISIEFFLNLVELIVKFLWKNKVPRITRIL